MQISESILLDVRRLLSEIMELDIDEIRPQASFFEVLDGESLELLELSFKLERIYGVRVRFQELLSEEYQLDERGCLTHESVALLETKFPFLKLDGFESRPLQRRGDFLTIEAIAGFVQMAVAAKPAAAPS